jgi:PAS domain S-box-containing protein
LIKKKENNEAENGATPVRHYLLTDRGYRQLIDNFPAFILGIELDGTISIFNKFAQTATGYTEDEIIGKKINDILQLEDPSFDTQPINLPPQGIEAPLLSANKSIRYIKWYFIPILSRHAELLGWGAFGSDVTEEKKRIEEIKYLASMSRRVIDAIPHSILLLDNELNIVDANRYHIEKVGEAQIWGKNIKELFPAKQLSNKSCSSELHGSSFIQR